MKSFLQSVAASALITSLCTATFAAPIAGPQPVAPAAMIPDTALTTYTGSFVFNFSITVKPGLPTTGYPIRCTATVTMVDGSGLVYSDSKTSLAVRSGSTATCSNLTIYYSWALASTAIPVSTSYQVVSDGSGTSLIDRIASGSLPGVALPANAGSLTRTVNVTI